MNRPTPQSDHSIIDALFVALELGGSKWQLEMARGGRRKRRGRRVEAGDFRALHAELLAAKAALGLPPNSEVFACYEAGFAGFAPYRELTSWAKTQCLVVASDSIKVEQGRKRAKTDRLDVRELLGMLLRYYAGDEGVFRVLRVPSVEAEDARHLHRGLEVLKKERSAHRNRIKGLLRTQGVCLRTKRELKQFRENFESYALQPVLRARLEDEFKRLDLCEEQLDKLEKLQRKAAAEPKTPMEKKVAKLAMLKGVGVTSAWILVAEFFGWREFNNRKEVGGAAGLTDTPWVSDGIRRNKGISKAGNRRVRAVINQVAWLWVRYQRFSRSAEWFRSRYMNLSRGMRKSGITALSRKLLVELWHYLEHDVVPHGAMLKST